MHWLHVSFIGFESRCLSLSVLESKNLKRHAQTRWNFFICKSWWISVTLYWHLHSTCVLYKLSRLRDYRHTQDAIFAWASWRLSVRVYYKTCVCNATATHTMTNVNARGPFYHTYIHVYNASELVQYTCIHTHNDIRECERAILPTKLVTVLQKLHTRWHGM